MEINNKLSVIKNNKEPDYEAIFKAIAEKYKPLGYNPNNTIPSGCGGYR